MKKILGLALLATTLLFGLALPSTAASQSATNSGSNALVANVNTFAYLNDTADSVSFSNTGAINSDSKTLVGPTVSAAFITAPDASTIVQTSNNIGNLGTTLTATTVGFQGSIGSSFGGSVTGAANSVSEFLILH